MKIIKKKNISVEILYFHTLKPFDSETVKKSLKKTKRLISIEELSAHDGLYNQCIKASIGINNLKTDQIAVNDFLHTYGSYEDLCHSTGLTKENIFDRIKMLVQKK